MCARRSMTGRQKTATQAAVRRGFTLIELLIVITVVGILMSALGVVLANSLRKAREAATVTTILKIDGLLDERLKGFDRATKSRDFQRIVDLRKTALEAAGIFGVSSKSIEAIARKDFYLQNFPQRFEELAPNTPSSGTSALPTLMSTDPQITYIAANHKRETESAALLHFMLTKMQVFGVPPVGESEFGVNEIRDTDGDGLPEFVDGWGNPLRFYRWPTRLLKPNGLFGPDGKPGIAGTDDDGNTLVDDATEIGSTLTTNDDYRALNPINRYAGAQVVLNDPNQPYHLPRRDIAGLLIDGLPPMPSTYAVGGNQLRIRYDAVDEDPDDPYGLIVSDMQRLAASGININVLPLAAPGVGYPEGTYYPTLDTYHTPLVVSVGADGVLGLYEPYVAADTDGDGLIDQFGVLAQPIHNGTNGNDIPSTTVSALTDNLTNRNRRAGKGK